MTKPTAAQQTILDAMAAGARLVVSTLRKTAELHVPGQPPQAVRLATFQAMARAHWIARVGRDGAFSFWEKVDG